MSRTILLAHSPTLSNGQGAAPMQIVLRVQLKKDDITPCKYIVHYKMFEGVRIWYDTGSYFDVAVYGEKAYLMAYECWLERCKAHLRYPLELSSLKV